MIKTFYNKYTDDQRVNFWVVVSNIVLVIFTFGFGILIQDSMLKSNQKINNALVRYDYGARVLPLIESVYSESGTKILYEFKKWEIEKDESIREDSLYRIYVNNKSYYTDFLDSLVHCMGALKYYFPEYEESIGLNNSKIIMIQGTLNYLDSIKRRRQLNIQKTNAFLDSLCFKPDIWIYGVGPDMDVRNSMSETFQTINDELNQTKSLEDSTAQILPELYQPLVDFNNQGIVAGEKLLIVKLNKAVFENIEILYAISHPETDSFGDRIGNFFTWQWIIFIFILLLGILSAVVFVVKIFPREINRNHSSQDYDDLKKKLDDTEALLYQYERQLKEKDSINNEKTTYIYTYRINS